MLQLDKISLSIGDERVLDNLSHTFREGEVSAIIGESGVGKTTLLHLLCGLRKPTEGKCYTADARMAFVFQEPRLFPWLTAYENIKTVCPKEPARADALLSAMRLTEAADKYPAALSGGMKQRVSIARALAYEPDILLLDEPFGGLDPELKAFVAQTVFSQMRGKTVIMVTHDENDLAYAHTVLRLTAAPNSRLIQEKSSSAENE